MAKTAARLIVGISGASGTIYGVRLLEMLRKAEIETHQVMSKSAEMTLAQNQTAFRELAVANVPIRVVRVSDANTLPSGYAVVIEGIYTTEERTNQNGKEGIIYFSSQRKESDLESIQREVQDAYQKMKEAGK